MKKWITRLLLLSSSAMSLNSAAQDKALVNTSQSSFAKLRPVDMGQVQWTRGFWAERFRVCRDSMVPNLWRIYNDATISHAFRNFEIAAGLDTGSHKGPSFHDGDYYKTLEAMASLYAATKDSRLDAMMDKAIEVIANPSAMTVIFIRRPCSINVRRARATSLKTGLALKHIISGI